MCLALIVFTGIDSSAKWLGQRLPSLEVSFVRYLVAFVVAAVVLNPVSTPQAWRTRSPWLQILRGLCLLGSTVFNFMALGHLQLAETVSIGFSAPLVIAALSGPILGEIVGPKRWLAIMVGFVGVLVIARPSPSHLDPAMLLSFANVLCYAVYAIVTRKLAPVDSAASMLVFSAAIAVVILAPAMPGVWVWPKGALEWGVVLLMGVCGALGHFLLILAFARAPASVVAPFAYGQIVWMGLAGYLVFGDVPARETLFGVAIVMASGLWLLWLERSAGRAVAGGGGADVAETPAVAEAEDETIAIAPLRRVA